MVKRLAVLTVMAAMIMAAPVYAGQWMKDGNGPNDVDQPDFLTTKVLVWRGMEIT